MKQTFCSGMTFRIALWKFFHKSYNLSNGTITKQIELSFKIGLFEILKLKLKTFR